VISLFRHLLSDRFGVSHVSGARFVTDELLLDMSSVCGRLDFKDAESHLESSSASSPNGSNQISCMGSEDAQESEGDGSSGYIHQSVNEEESKDISEPISESLNAEGEDKNVGIAVQDSFSESVSVAPIIIPAIKGSREKHGKSLEKLRVSWAEDVYDPTPSIVSHTRSKKQQQTQKSKSRDNLKKNGKKGQKGSSNSSSSSSRGSKDKKSSSPSRSKQSRDKFGWGAQMPIVAASS